MSTLKDLKFIGTASEKDDVDEPVNLTGMDTYSLSYKVRLLASHFINCVICSSSWIFFIPAVILKHTHTHTHTRSYLLETWSGKAILNYLLKWLTYFDSASVVNFYIQCTCKKNKSVVVFLSIIPAYNRSTIVPVGVLYFTIGGR